MKNFTIIRVSSQPYGVFGVMIEGSRPEGGQAFALTAERPWKQNKINISCIPPGTYTAYLRKRSNGVLAYELRAVPGRSGILLHKGNIPQKDSKGCILVGEKFDVYSEAQVVLGLSGEGFGEFMARAGGNKEILITILDPFNLTVGG